MNMAVRSDTSSLAPGFRPGRTLRVFGMRRSGNHAILDAFLRNAPGGNVAFFNNCKRAQDPLGTYRSLELRCDGTELKVSDTLAVSLEQLGQAPLAIVSVEDAMPRRPMRQLWDAEEQIVVIYRSFLNWAASLLKKLQGNAAYGALERARIMTNACRTYAKALEIADAPSDVQLVLYDRWTGSEAYRAEVLSNLHLSQSDLSLGDVQRYGGGSSFQKGAQTAAELGVDRRADQMADDPEFGMLLWYVAHETDLAQSIARHFPDDAERILGLAETAGLTFHLPEGGHA